MPLVSVIIPTYNGGRYIRSTVESALSQTLTDIEILVIDDGSEEDLSALLAPYADRIQYVYKDRSGPAATRNMGIRLSKGKYVALLDHDDLWHPDKLKVQVDILESRQNSMLAYCYPELIDADGHIIANERPSSLPDGDVVLDFLKRNWITTFSATLVRRSVFDDIGFLDESPMASTCDDYDMWLRIADVSNVAYTPGEWTYYRIHPGNLLKNYEQNLAAHMYVLEKFVRSSRRLRALPERRVARVVRRNKYDKYRHFAFIYYYGEGAGDARKLFWKLLMLRPFVIVNWLHLIVASLPEGGRNFLRRLKVAMKPA